MAAICRRFPNYGFISFISWEKVREDDSLFYEGTEEAIDGTTWDIFYCWDDSNYYYTKTEGNL